MTDGNDAKPDGGSPNASRSPAPQSSQPSTSPDVVAPPPGWPQQAGYPPQPGLSQQPGQGWAQPGVPIPGWQPQPGSSALGWPQQPSYQPQCSPQGWGQWPPPARSKGIDTGTAIAIVLGFFLVICVLPIVMLLLFSGQIQVLLSQVGTDL